MLKRNSIHKNRLKLNITYRNVYNNVKQIKDSNTHKRLGVCLQSEKTFEKQSFNHVQSLSVSFGLNRIKSIYSLTDGNMLYTSNPMKSLQILGIGKIKLTHNQQSDANSFTLPAITIKGYDTELEQSIMNAFISNLPVENNTNAPFSPYITESVLQSYLASQFIKNTSNAKVFGALTDKLWVDLYTDIHVNNLKNFELRFSLRPIMKHWSAEEGKRLDALLNNTPQKVMKLSQLQYKFYEKYNTFIQGEQSKRPLSKFLSSKAKYCVLPIKTGDYLFTFTSYSV